VSEVSRKSLDETPHLAQTGVDSLSELPPREGDMGTLSASQEKIESPELEEKEEPLKIESKQEAKRQEVKKRRKKAEQEAKEEKEKEKNMDKEQVKRNIKEAKQLFQTLGQLQRAGKERRDKRVQEIEKRLRMIFYVAPNSWVSPDKPLRELITTLETYFEKNSAALQEGSELGDVALLDGRALQGVLVTSNLGDQKKERASLLRVPEEVSLTGVYSPKEYTVIFSSKEQEDSYRATVDVLGHSVAASAMHGAVLVSTGLSENEEEKDKMYSSTVKYCSMDMATCNFGSKDIMLSDDAKEDLKLPRQKASRENVRVSFACTVPM
jgi:hypothetical protein